MQFQADLLDLPVERPLVAETTALGAAYAAGLAVGVWPDPAALAQNWQIDRVWRPALAGAERDRLMRGWKKAVERSLGWVG
jgi:glycerol kinase